MWLTVAGETLSHTSKPKPKAPPTTSSIDYLSDSHPLTSPTPLVVAENPPIPQKWLLCTPLLAARSDRTSYVAPSPTSHTDCENLPGTPLGARSQANGRVARAGRWNSRSAEEEDGADLMNER